MHVTVPAADLEDSLRADKACRQIHVSFLVEGSCRNGCYYLFHL